MCQFSQPYWQCQKDSKFSIQLYSKRGNQMRLQTTKRGNQIKHPILFPDLLWKCAILQKHHVYRKKKNEANFFIVWTLSPSSPLYKGVGGSTFSKFMEMGGGLKMFTRKGGGRQNGGLSRNGGLPYYIVIFLEIPYNAA